VITPTQESVRRAIAIQLFIGREFGLMKNENVLQGSYALEYLTDLVEDAVLHEIRSPVRAGWSSGCDGNRIPGEQDPGRRPLLRIAETLGQASNHRRKYLRESRCRIRFGPTSKEVARSTDDEKEEQIRNLQLFQNARPERPDEALRRLCDVARAGGNVFAELMETVKYASLGQISNALFEVDGRYGRSM
jgi:methylmalonyl-CoA mutase